MKKPESICIFGDSTAWGAWDMEKGGWVNRLWLHVADREENYVEIYNLSISGGTTDMILERFEKESTIRYNGALIFQTGGNDASCEHGTYTHKVSPEVFEKNIRHIIEKAKKLTNHIIFIGFKNCDESKTLPVSWVNIDYRNADLQKYDAIMKRVCEEHGVLFCDIKPLDNDDFHDGLHPNAFGHEKIFVQVRDFLVAHGWI
jgi:lysophospholipase L1-like esterase